MARRPRKIKTDKKAFELYKAQVYLDDRWVSGCPHSGWSNYIVIEEDDANVGLFCPFTLKHLCLPKKQSLGRTKPQTFQWERDHKPQAMDNASMADFIEARAHKYVELGLGFPGNVTRKLVADLRGVAIEEIEPMKTTQAEKPKAAAKKDKAPKGPGVIETLVKSINKTWQTEDQLVAKLSAAFPDRDAEKMRKTIRTQLSRIPKERGIKLDKDKEKGVRLAA